MAAQTRPLFSSHSAAHDWRKNNNTRVRVLTTLKEWTRDEKERLSKYLKILRMKLPNLCHRVGRIGIARVKEIPTFGECKAATTYMVILLSDYFFNSSGNEFTTLVHEFAHRADSGGQLAYSRLWADFAKKNVVFSRRAGYEPSLKEKLAIAMEYYVEGKLDFDRAGFEKKILPLLTDVSSESIELNRLLALANEEHCTHNYESALRFYEQANKLLPNSPAIFYGEACFKTAQHKNKEAIELLSKVQNLLKENQIPLYDPLATTVQLLLASYFCEKNDVVDSLALLRSLEDTRPSKKILANIKLIQRQCQRRASQAKLQ